MNAASDRPAPMTPGQPRIRLALGSTLVATIAIWLLTGLPQESRAAEVIRDCTPKDNARPICGFKNPEDMVVLPGDKALLIGQYGQSAKDHSGGLVLFDLETEERRIVFRGGEKAAVAEPGWGDPSCKTPPTRAFNSHGIDLVRRDDGRLALLVVQHGGREAIEFFEVIGQGRDWHVAWRGCVASPPDASLNEVAARPDGTFLTTKMASLAGAASLENAFPDQNTGLAFSWTPERGYAPIPGSEGIMPNGIVVSSDGRYAYMNASLENSIRKLDLEAGREVGRASVATPDNVTWAPDGRLLIASLRGLDPEEFELCASMTEGACPIPFSIVAVDPKTMTNEGAVYESDGPPMGAGTVGLQVGQELFIGSFKGDRILRVALEAR